MTTRLLLCCAMILATLLSACAQEWPWAKYGLPPSTNPTCIPLKRTDWAEQYHVNMLARDKKPDLQLVFLGDSITMMWRSQSGTSVRSLRTRGALGTVQDLMSATPAERRGRRVFFITPSYGTSIGLAGGIPLKVVALASE